MAKLGIQKTFYVPKRGTEGWKLNDEARKQVVSAFADLGEHEYATIPVVGLKNELNTVIDANSKSFCQQLARKEDWSISYREEDDMALIRPRNSK